MTTLSTAARNAAADAVVDLLDGGTGDGNLVIYTSGQGSTLVTIPFGGPAFAPASNGVASVSGTPSASATAGGDAAEWEAQDGDGTVIFDGTASATGGGGDIEFDDISVVNGATITVSSLTYTQPAS